MRFPTFAAIVLCVAVSCDASERPGVARIGGRTIARSELACSPDVEKSRCRGLQQQKFKKITFDLLLHEAARLHQFQMTDEQVVRAAPKGSIPSDAAFASAAERVKPVISAVIRVKEGADVGTVYAEELSHRGFTVQQFESAIRGYPTAAAARADLARDAVAVFRSQTIEQQRLRLYATWVRDHLTRQATRGASPDKAAELFWRDVISRSETEVFDDQFELPRMEDAIQ